MSLKRKMEKVKNVYKDITLLLNALPYEDSRQIEIEMELDNENFERNLEKAEKQYKQLLMDVETIYMQLEKFHSEMLDRLPVQELLSSQRSYLPVLTAVMDMVPEDEDNKDIVWVRNWLTHPQLNLEEASYFFINACKASAEALAIHCHVLMGQWEHIVLDLIPLFETYFRQWEMRVPFITPGQREDHVGFISKRFNKWIIHVVGNPEICPNSILCFKMLFFFRVLKMDDENYQQAFMSAFSVFLSLDTLDTHGESQADALTTEILNFFQLYQFTESNHLYQFGLQLAEHLKNLRNTRQLIMINDVSFDYAMGLKTAAEPSEILGLIAILKYISVRIDFHYDALQESPNNIRHIRKIDEALNILDIIICNFKTTIEDPQLLDMSAECIMNITEKGLLSHYKKFQDSIGDLDEEFWDTDTITDNISPINLFFIELAVDGEDGDGSPGIVSQEIIRKYKERICRLRTQIPMKFMDVSVPLSLVIYNSKY